MVYLDTVTSVFKTFLCYIYSLGKSNEILVI